MKFFNASGWRNFHSIQSLGNSHQKVFMEVLVSASPEPQHRHWSQYWHWHCKHFFWLQKSFLKIEYLFSFLFLVMASVPPCYKSLFLYDLLSIYPKTFIGVIYRKRLFELLEASVHWILKKWTAPNVPTHLVYFPENVQGEFLFTNTRRPSCDFSKKLFKAAIL